ncbi:response regulator [Paenibacillus qinlingensis]|uniref:Two-component system response regulator YesN n=1 Tax=Paenibacillus qinlingensis TaxID=1837343 RepID=A0ABU1NWU4_9BACL|nr:response regulator [Paenibacillus qinlingensis]MDR6551935.1 two-component system response regulator YesN [Paenibacillus qinlingensis]
MSEKPISVLIVDDELPLRQELRSLPWSTLGARLVGEAENGAEAAALCEELQPDLVITDITMPIMNGMELFRTLRNKWPQTQVVLLTCHSDFHYAQEAVKLGALDYFTKLSFDEEDMQALIDKTRAAMSRQLDLRHYGQDQQRRQLAKLVNMLTKEGSVSALELQTIWEAWQTEAPLYLNRLAIDVQETNRFHLMTELEQILKQWEHAPNHHHTSAFQWCLTGDREVLLVFRQAASEADAMLLMDQLLAELHAALERALPYMSGAFQLLAVTGEAVRQPQDLLSSLRSIAVTPALLFYGRPLATTAARDAAQGETEPDAHQDALLIRQRWLQAAKDKTELQRFYQEDFGPWALQNRFNPAKLIAYFLRVREEAIAAHSHLRHSEQEAMTAQLLAAGTLTELISLFTRELAYGEGDTRKVRKEVQLARKIIMEKLGEPITLTSVSEEVGLSSYYLSRLFKEVTGESFNDYVTRLRMEKAVQLLQTTQMKVYEVAEQVGIPSYRYFSQLFRNWTGVAPTEYKKG